MITFKNGCTTKELQGLKVGVYFNLHKRGYSVKAFEGEYKGKVVAYISLDHNFILKDVEFKVSDAGRDRVRNTGHKNVHAYVVGTYSEVLWKDLPNLQSNTLEVTYNPYLYEYFVVVQTLEPIYQADEVRFTAGKILVPKDGG